MDDLLPHYERELTFLRRHAREFAERYPKVAGRLALSGDAVEDPHVERLLESFALLTARVHKKLDDEFPQFTETLLEVLYPHYLRPFPACSIARFDPGSAAAQLSAAVRIPRGALLMTRPVKGVACKFRTGSDVDVAPIRVAEATYHAAARAPENVRLPADAAAWISITFELTSPQAALPGFGIDRLRLFLDGEPSLVAAIREAMLRRAGTMFVEIDGRRVWHALGDDKPQVFGFDEDDALIEFDARSHPAYRLLTEYFAFPEKFNFVDLPLERMAAHVQAARRFTVHVPVRGLRTDSSESRLLERLTGNQFVLGCVPVVNLFRQSADPIRVTHTKSSYPLVADARRAQAFEIYSVDAVRRVRQTPEGDSVETLRAFYSLHHGDTRRDSGRYWYVHRDGNVADRSPGYEQEIAIVDIDFDPAVAQTDTLSIELTCTNRDLPSQLPIGLIDGDLFMEGGTVAKTISLLRRPTPSMHFERGRGALWRLISHLSLNHLSLADNGVNVLRETLRLYDLARSQSNSQQIDGIVAIESKPATAWLPGNPFPCFVRGIEIRVTIDEDGYVGSGIYLFSQVLDAFFGLYVHANSFVQLVIVSKRTGAEILKCPPHNGESILA